MVDDDDDEPRFTLVQRVYLGELHRARQDEEIAGLRSELARTKGIALMLLIAVFTAVVTWALNGGPTP